jgi:hypothetical protein
MTDGSERAWRLGREAGLSDGAGDANPYDPGSDLAADWADGWLQVAGGRKDRQPTRDQAWAAWRTAADEDEGEDVKAS